MRKAERLKRQARNSANLRGHVMTRFHAMHSRCSTAQCVRCGCFVYVQTNPQPNETEISGAAVAVNCEVEK